MKRIRPFVFVFLALVAIPMIVEATIQQQRGQIFVNIEIDVTPAPLAMNAAPAKSAFNTIVTRATLTEVKHVRSFSAEALSFVPGSLVAQTAGQQKSVRVDAEISPNPNATLLTSNNCQGSQPQPGSCNHVAIPVTAGQTTTVICAYQISVTTTQTSWTLDHGLFTNWESLAGAVAFPGGDVKNSTYYASPGPAYTPFVVFTSDGGVWASVGTGSLSKTYCVNLEITVPATVAQGSYYSNATYTLLY